MKLFSTKRMTVVVIAAAALVGAYQGLRALRWSGHSFARMERGWTSRFGTEKPNALFSSRIKDGMTPDEVMRVVPPPDSAQFLLLRDGKVVQRLRYAIPSTWDYNVYVLYRGGRVSNLEFDDAYLDSPRPINESEARRRLAHQALPPGP